MPRAKTTTAHFSAELFRFLRELEQNNDKAWFAQNKARYEQDVKQPLLAFITDFTPKLARISKHYVADARPNGGSMFRIYRDVRFSKDKRPYKTAAAAHFRHEAGKDVHAPGFYLHLAPGEVFAGAGIWQPDGKTLAAVRQAIVDDPAGYKRAISGKAFREACTLGGASLKRPPRGFDPDHVLIDELKRKDFVASVTLSEAAATRTDFIDAFASACKTVGPFVRFLTGAIDQPF